MPDATNDLNRVLERLDYPDGWLSSGLLPADFFMLQLRNAEAEEEFASEHYRHGAFLEILRRYERLTDEQFRAYLSLAEEELSTVLYATPLIALARWGGLTDTQREELVHRAPGWPKAVARALGLSGLNRPGIPGGSRT